MIGEKLGRGRHADLTFLQIEHLGLGPQFLEQAGGAAIPGEARYFAAGVVQVAEGHRFGGTGLHARRLHIAIGQRPALLSRVLFGRA